MRRRRRRLEAINRDLDRAARLLDSAAGKLRDADFGARRDILRVAEALGRISDIQFEIYAARPGLLPRKLVATKFGAKVLSNKPVERAAMKPEQRNRRTRPATQRLRVRQTTGRITP
jgi:hypothetical protein